ncbi:sensor histidine kinase [Rubrivirga litoralis]|uniref:histidine kinase n=1 Tax=Rubrivirga litoralis TaxID=3075598 RepID=A0ABU3BMI0_9BACT|nr:HAMP domain-containing sensor histidine kinase [Rubrivirga sp. F394]MDT0630481.1 HAMP domain-containing sensor histidine kinase [Rubrivirga sp. F394]
MLPRLPLVLLVFAVGGASAQTLPSPREGTVYRSHTSSWDTYEAHNQNWGVTQGPTGLVFVANGQGVLEFDGEDWRLHELPKAEAAMVRSVAVGADGRTYVGGAGDLGRLVADCRGFLQYESLREHLPRDEQNFSDVWATHATPEGVVFQTDEGLYRWDGARFQLWFTSTRFQTSFLVDEVVYVWEENVGIKRLQGGDLRLVPGAEWFANRKIDGLLPHAQGLVAVVRGEGLVRLHDGRVTPMGGAGSDYLVRYRPYSAVAVPDAYGRGGSLYAVGTLGGGVAIIAPDGGLVRVYREDVGLSVEDYAVDLHADRQGGLWVATLNGITWIDLFSRYTAFDRASGLLGSVYHVNEVEGALYAGTALGLYRLVPGALGRPGGTPAYARFEPVPGIPEQAQTWQITPTAAGALVPTDRGVFQVREGRGRQVTADLAFAALVPSARPALAFVGLKDGVGILRLRGDRWVRARRLDGVEGETRFFYEGPGGEVWMAQTAGDVYRVTGLDTGRLHVERFTEANGLTVGGAPISGVGDEVRISSREGVFRMRVENERLRLTPVPAFRDVQGTYGLFTLGDRSWLSQDGVFQTVEGGDGAGGAASGLALRGVQVLGVSETAGGVLWVATADGLVRYDPRVRQIGRPAPAFLRAVTDRHREALWGGAAAWSPDPDDPDERDLVLPFGQPDELRFVAAAAFFGDVGEVEYQFRLDGYADEWSAWGPERVTTNTNLWEGQYTVRVRARDGYGRVSDEARFGLRVLPPWYRTWWAFTLYVLVVCGLVWALVGWRLRQHRKRLDVQRARSARLQRLSDRLAGLNARIRDADRLKVDLLANTSHELRTPLTAILGYSEILLDEAEGETRTLAESIHRGGRRLLGTVNGLLDMFKLQSGTFEVHAEPVDVAAAVGQSVRLLQPLAAERGLDLAVLPEGRPLPAHLDPALLDRVVTNLVGNAIKFTDAGRVVVLLDGDDHAVRVTVRDTGVGIAEGDVERLFEPFEQASSGFARSHEGTGLGLSIVRQVVGLVGGSVHVESAVGEGTSVEVVFPREWEAPEAQTAGLDPYGGDLGGAYLLALDVGDAAAAFLDGRLGPAGRLRLVPTLGRALREARTTVYDVVLVGAAPPAVERKRVALIRSVSGYERVAVVRVGGAALDAEGLRRRGFTDQLPGPFDAARAAVLLERALGEVPELAEA